MIFYNENKNFLGEIEFYELGSMPSSLEIDGRKYEIKGDKVKFYKGPCKNKNFFSCCDVSVNSEEFEALEVPYG